MNPPTSKPVKSTKGGDTVEIPTSVIKMLSVVLMMSIAWFPWATVTLIKIQVKTELFETQLAKSNERYEQVVDMIPKLQILSRQVDVNVANIDKLANKIDKLVTTIQNQQINK